MVYELYAYLDWISLQCTPFSATGEYLDAWANLRGIFREDATASTGVVLFTGVTGTDIPAGTVISRSDATQYSTDLDWHIGSLIPLTFTALVPGAAGNADTGITLTISSPIANVISAGTATQAVVGGSEQELDPAFRQRMLAAYAAPPNGGSANDFIGWCRAVPGCTRAWVQGGGAGVGSVLLWVMFDNAESAFSGFPQGSNGGATLETRIAAATGDQLLVANYIYPLRPVTCLVQVNAPIAAPINFVIQSLSIANTVVEAAINAALADMFLRLGAPLGNPIYPSDVNAAIESVASVQRYTLVSPITPITVAVGAIPVVGTVVYS